MDKRTKQELRDDCVRAEHRAWALEMLLKGALERRTLARHGSPRAQRWVVSVGLERADGGYAAVFCRTSRRAYMEHVDYAERVRDTLYRWAIDLGDADARMAYGALHAALSHAMGRALAPEAVTHA